MPQDLDTLLVPTTTHGRVLVRRPAGNAVGLLAGFHGYAEDAATQLERLVAIPGTDRWLLVSIQALHRFYRGRSKDVVAGWMTHQDRDVAILDNLAYVDAAIERALQDVATRATVPIVYAGFSQGVAMAFRAGLRGRQPTAGVIAVGGDVPPELREDPHARFPRTLLIRGTGDDWYTAAKLDADVAAIEARGGQVKSVVFDGGHEWTAAVSAVGGEFLSGLLSR
jgi:predicted esterase